ncbi:MAG: sigma-70 family RNA polymerase sigma factor [Thermoleophilia bacterium]
MDAPRPLSAIRRRRRPVSDLDDAELFRLIAGGSETAFDALWRRYGEAVLGLCRAILRDPQAAEDAAQEAFARVWRFAATVDPRRGEPAGWLMTVARNSALNVARVTLPEPVPEPFERPVPSREQEMIDALWLRGALTRLPDREREVIRLAYFAGLSHTQIAARVDEPLGTVKSRIRRGLARLAELAEGR